MKKFYIYLLILILCTSIYAQAQQVDRLSVSFSDPSRPGFIKVNIIDGSITVTGGNNKEVLIEATTQTQKIKNDKTLNDNKMKRLEYNATGLTVEEEDNEMNISTSSHKRTIDLTISVPEKTSLVLKTINHGDIYVKNVEGELDVNNINGKVTLENISGSVVAHALNKDLTVTFAKIDPDKAMSFTTLNGDIDVTFPAKLKADFKLKSDNGEFFSDFEVTIDPAKNNSTVEDNRDSGGKYKISVDKYMRLKINGGGQEILMSSLNGNIFIRKGK